MIVGLTGQSGAGKTTVCRVLKNDKDIAVIDCDALSKNVTMQGSEFLRQVRDIYPEAVDDKLTLDRRKMSEIVFSDKEELKKYESLIFPFITREIVKEIHRLKDAGYDIIVLDAPTLFDAGADKLCDTIISICADKEKRLERIKKRDKLPDELILKRFKSQRSSEFFKENSDYFLENNGTNEELSESAQKIIMTLKENING